MQTLEITADMLPMYQIEVANQAGDWMPFTIEPFATKEAAEAHRLEVLKEYHGNPERVRVAYWDRHHWHAKLIVEVMKDERATEVALTILSPETLRDILCGRYNKHGR